jgi:hypothetical protein
MTVRMTDDSAPQASRNELAVGRAAPYHCGVIFRFATTTPARPGVGSR